MIISWLIYLAVAIGTGAFFVFYSDLIALIVLITVLAIPVLLFIIHFLAFVFTKIEVEVNDEKADLENPVKILIKVKNNSPFPVTHIRLSSGCKNLFLNTEYKARFVINSVPFSQKVFTYELNSEHIGNIEFTLEKASFYDFFSMFRLSKKLNIKRIVPLYPQTVSVSSHIRPNNWFVGEADKFSNVKAGDDPSEIFDIREYVEGDKLNKIHWKLSSKTDTFMVKEYSLPVSDNVFIYLDLKAKDTTDESLGLIDSLLKTYASVSLSFARKNIEHYVGWYNARTSVFVKTKIKSESDVYITLGRIFSDTIFVDEPMFEKCDFFLKQKYSHIITITSNPAKDAETIFAGFDISLSLLSVVCVEYERSEIPAMDNTKFIPVIPGAEEKCLYHIKF